MEFIDFKIPTPQKKLNIEVLTTQSDVNNEMLVETVSLE